MGQYTLGAIGIGHWFERLYIGMKESNRIKVAKAAGANPASGKTDRLNALGLTKDDYYAIPESSIIPRDFFGGLDIVHISDPNEFHALQTKQSLGEGKITITEKTWGINRKEFNEVVGFIRKNGFEKKAYLHLHYTHKTLTMNLEELLKKYTARYGKVRAVSMTFFENVREGDMRRKGWLFSTGSGGLFMDWIHPFEILHFGAKADSMSLGDIELYAENPDYDLSNPTGIHAEVNVSGRFFSGGTVAFIRIAKGTKENKKSARFVFESGSYLDLNYMDSETEFHSNRRGSWGLYENGKKIEEGEPEGPTTSDILVSDMVKMCEGTGAGFSVDEAVKIFEPQWEYQELVKKKSLRANREENERFIRCGLTLAIDSCILA